MPLAAIDRKGHALHCLWDMHCPLLRVQAHRVLRENCYWSIRRGKKELTCTVFRTGFSRLNQI